MRLGVYDLVVYNRNVKSIVASALRNPWIVENPVYRFLYNRRLQQVMNRNEELPFRVMLENTNVCPADCVFCPHEAMVRTQGIMDLSISKKVTDECAVLGVKYLTIYGFGEPLLDPRFLERVRYAKQKGIPRVTTNTSAMFMNQKIVEGILESGLDEIYISFDADTEKTYKVVRPGLVFDTTRKNILNLCQEKKRKGFKKPEIILSFVESQWNKDEIEDYIKEWKDKVNNISISIIHNWTGAMKGNNPSSSEFRDPCRLIWTDMVVSWNGDVPLCCNDYEDRVILGNVREKTIPEVWGGERLKLIRDFHKKGEFQNVSVCANCTYNYHHKSPWWVSR